MFASALLKVKPEHSEAALLVLEAMQRNQSYIFMEHLSNEDKRSLWAQTRDQVPVMVISRIYTLVSHVITVDVER